MDSGHLVDPQLRTLLETFPTRTFTHESLATLRGERFPSPPFEKTGVTQQVLTVPGPTGVPDINLTIYRPLDAKGLLPCIYHIHGGGYVVGDAASNAFMHYPLVAELGCMLVSVDYRLAPEAIFPAAIEDCYAGLSWTFEHAVSLGIEVARIGVMGESAGGGLAAALALLARDRGEYRLAFQHLIYPMLDDRTCTSSSPHPYAGEFIWHAANNHFGWSALLGHEPGERRVSPYAAPARATDLTRLPPSFLATGALDLFMEEDIEFARRLARAGVPVELHVYPGAFHGFDLVADADVSRDAIRDSRAALRRFLW